MITDIFRQFLVLGLISFGGPAAHVGYFHRRFVEELQWLDEAEFARLLALTQFLPGPASSQLGFAIGRVRGGVFGAFAAFVAFTLPSFLLMALLGIYATSLPVWLQGGMALKINFPFSGSVIISPLRLIVNPTTNGRKPCFKK